MTLELISNRNKEFTEGVLTMNEYLEIIIILIGASIDTVVSINRKRHGQRK